MNAHLTSSISTVMYPDEQHFYDADEFKEFYCPNAHETKFTTCLQTNDVKSNDTNDPKYRECHDEKKIRYKNCIAENGADYILKRHLNRSRPFKCDKSNLVYTLTRDESNFLKPYDECSRPFVVQRIAHSNLILLITNRNCAQVFATVRDFEDVPITIEYGNSTFCHKLDKPPLFRSRPKTCMTHHEKVRNLGTKKLRNFNFCVFQQEPKFDPTNIDRSICGRGHQLQADNLITLCSTILILLKTLIST